MRAEHNSVVQEPSLVEVAPYQHAADRRGDLSMGAHVITSRRGYLHHGIYVGGGRVVHYSGWAHGLHRGPVEEIPLDRFSCGATVWVRRRSPNHFDPCEVVRRARSRVGENHYRVFSNNCEHFCEWCVQGEPRSYQVEALLSLPTRVLETALGLIAKLFPLLTGVLDRHSFKGGAAAHAGDRKWGLLRPAFVVEGDKLC